MELQDHLSILRSQNIEPYAISYDSVETLRAFAKGHGITYPLLSDAGSEVIRGFGILNTLVAEDHRWYGIPFPGTYMVDEDGIVFDKTFYADHVARDTITRMANDVFCLPNAGHGDVHRFETPAYEARVFLSGNRIRRGQVHTLTVALDIADGFHIQAAPLPDGYIPLEITVDAVEGVQVDPFAYPDSTPYRIPGLDDQLNTYEGSVSLKTRVLFNVREPVTLAVHLQAQACDARDCLLPETHTFELATEWLPNP